MAVPVRDLLAVVLGVGLGLLLVAYPRVIVRVHTVGRTPRSPPGPAGEDAAIDDRWLWLVRALGAGSITVGLVVGYRLVA